MALPVSKSASVTEYRKCGEEIWKDIKSWKPTYEVAFIRHGPIISAVAAGVSGGFINAIFRRRYKLGSFARIVTYLPVVGFPAVAAALIQQFSVERMIFKPNRCPTCLTVRSMSFQCLCGVIYPALFAPFACLSFATRYLTVALPKDNKEALQYAVKDALILLRKRSNFLWSLFVCQAVVGGALIYAQQRTLIYISQKAEPLEFYTVRENYTMKGLKISRTLESANWSNM